MKAIEKERRDAGLVYDQAYADIWREQEESLRPYTEALEQARVKAIGIFQAKSKMIWQIYTEAMSRIDKKYEEQHPTPNQ